LSAAKAKQYLMQKIFFITYCIGINTGLKYSKIKEQERAIKRIAATETQTLTDKEAEPPGEHMLAARDAEEEPPSMPATALPIDLRNVPSDLWNDWKWHFRNRITSVEELTKYIPLSEEEQSQLKWVTVRYPLSITPYYLSLINASDPNDPVRKQAVPSILELSMKKSRLSILKANLNPLTSYKLGINEAILPTAPNWNIS